MLIYSVFNGNIKFIDELKKYENIKCNNLFSFYDKN